MDNIKNLDSDKNINFTTNNKPVDTSSNINIDIKINNKDAEEIENTESHQNILNTFSLNDVEELDLSIFEE